MAQAGAAHALVGAASAKHFQKRNVSSAAAEQTVTPSGDCARCSTRELCPVISATCADASLSAARLPSGSHKPASGASSQMGKGSPPHCQSAGCGGSRSKRADLSHGRVLPEAELVLAEAMAAQDLLLMPAPLQRAHLRSLMRLFRAQPEGLGPGHDRLPPGHVGMPETGPHI